MTLSVRLATSVSRLSVLLPTLAAVMLKLSAVMSVVASPSTTAPTVLKLTALPVAVKLPTVKSPALKLTVTSPVAVTLVKTVLPALLKLNKPVDRSEWFMTPMTVNAYANPPLGSEAFAADSGMADGKFLLPPLQAQYQAIPVSTDIEGHLHTSARWINKHKVKP